VNFIERVMRVMTHINIGAALGLTAWVLWSGWHIVTGQIVPVYRVAEFKPLMSAAHAGQSAPRRLVPVHAAGGSLPPCHDPQPAMRQHAVALSGADL
jgi:hypothetical protein